MKMGKRVKLLILMLLIFAAAASMSFLIKQIDFKYETGIAPKRISKEPGYHTQPILDWRDKSMVRLGDFQTNVKVGENGQRFLKTKISLKTSGEEASEEIKKYNVIVRDLVIKTLGSRHFDEIRTEAGKMELKESIQNDLNTLLSKGDIKEVYFTEFIVQ